MPDLEQYTEYITIRTLFFDVYYWVETYHFRIVRKKETNL